MSFPNQGFWMEKGSGVPGDGEMSYENSSRIETKRPHQWFMDGPEADLAPNKKQAVEVPTNSLFSGMFNPNVPAWGNALGFHSVPGHFTERLFDAETARPPNFHDKSIPSISTEKIILGRSGNEELYSDPSFCLSMSHTLEDPQSAVNCGRIRKAKVSEVKDTDNIISSPNEQSYERVDNTSMQATNSYRVDENSTSMGLAFDKAEENVISMTGNYDRRDGIFISMGQPYSKVDENISMASYKESNSTLARDLTFNKVENNMISMGQTYNAGESSASKSNVYHKENSHSVPGDGRYNRADNSLSVGQSYSKGQSTIISFGGSNDDDSSASRRIISSYEFLMGQSLSRMSGTPNDKDLVESGANSLRGHATYSSIEVSTKKEAAKMSKKVQNNSFPSNVRSLLSTGMLDGVPVKYIAWSREKELCGVIKGSGYQCGCQSCDFSKVINAYEFERHACCKTKHPNNHIYFENGKTVYGIVQELRNTRQDMLFDAIQMITGSPINQKSFRLWKESYLAATRELQRIYGKDEGNLL